MIDNEPALRPRRWKRRRIWLVILIVPLVLFRGPLLRTIHGFLALDDESDRADAVLVVDGDFRHERAAELLRQNAIDKILLIAERPRRTTIYGILPSRERAEINRLVALGVPQNVIALIGIPTESNEWRSARAVKEWLRSAPNARVIVLCSRHDSRRTRYVFNRILGSEKAQQVFVQGLASGRYDEANWWRSREGWKSIFGGYLSLFYAWICGEDKIVPTDWNPDEFEQRLRERL